MTRTTSRFIALLAVLMLFAAACGQKANVAQVSASGGGVSGGDAFGGSVDGGGDAFGDLGTDDLGGGDLGGDLGGGDAGTGGGDAGTGGATGGDTGTGTGGDAGTGGGDAGTGGGTGGGTDGGAATQPGDRTGITADTIKIGIHAPVTGAAPFPQSSFEAGKEIYWDFVEAAEGGVFGKLKVEVVFRDDKFDPRTARDVCKEMVEQEKVFLLVGGGGADQITACATYAQSVGVPYISGGVNEDGLSNVRAYFAGSATYSQQSPPIAQLIKKRFSGQKVAIAVADSGSFNDAQKSITAEAGRQGLNVVYNKRIPKAASQSEALTIANDIRSSGATVVYFLSSPVTFLNVSAAGAGQAFKPQYIGPGITSGLQTVATVGCQGPAGVDKAIFLSPFPQLDKIDQVDPNYQKAYRTHGGGDGDDVGIALWGLNKTLHQMFIKAGAGMSRQSFVATLESGAKFTSGVFPPAQYSAKNHFGAPQFHVLEAKCSESRFITTSLFASSF